LKTWLQIERERSFVLETYVNGAIIRGKEQFYTCDDLALGLRESENAPVRGFISGAGAGSLTGSHDRLSVGDFGQGRVRVSRTGASRYSAYSLILNGKATKKSESPLEKINGFSYVTWRDTYLAKILNPLELHAKYRCQRAYWCKFGTP
jgi:hypothetical protein